MDVLADEVYFSLFAEGLLEFDDVGVREGFEYFNLSEDNLFVLFVSVVFLKLFDGDKFASFFVLGFEDHAVFAFSDLVQNLVFVH
jgi:hypothetical protein